MQPLTHLLELAAIAFFLHIIWERAHVRLYSAYEHKGDRLPITVWAALGDAVYSVTAVLFIGLLKNNFDWMPSIQMVDIVALAIIGLFIALYIEYRALTLHRWAYAVGMPVIPVLKVGLSPVLEMAILLPASVAFVALLSHSMVF